MASGLWRIQFLKTDRDLDLPGESQGRGSLVGCHLWGRKESEMTEATQQQQQQQQQRPGLAISSPKALFLYIHLTCSFPSSNKQIHFSRTLFLLALTYNQDRKSSVQFISVVQWCLTLCDPVNRSTPGLPVHHHLPEFTPTHVHQVGDAIHPSHPLSPPSPTAPNPSQHQGGGGGCVLNAVMQNFLCGASISIPLAQKEEPSALS